MNNKLTQFGLILAESPTDGGVGPCGLIFAESPTDGGVGPC